MWTILSRAVGIGCPSALLQKFLEENCTFTSHLHRVSPCIINPSTYATRYTLAEGRNGVSSSQNQEVVPACRESSFFELLIVRDLYYDLLSWIVRDYRGIGGKFDKEVRAILAGMEGVGRRMSDVCILQVSR